MMKKIQKYGLVILMIAFSIIFIGYKKVFIREDNGKRNLTNTLGTTFNTVPYTEYFFTKQKKPSVFFTTPAFPSYTKWCHENKKLCSVLPLQQIYADMQWIGSIQFVGSQDIPNKYLGLSKLLDNLTNLAPYWEYPYAFGQLLLPMGKKQVDGEDINTIKQSWEDARILAEKGEYYTCDPDKIKDISALDENTFIKAVYDKEHKSYTEPCPIHDRAHNAAFNAFYYKKDIEESARNYRISSFITGSPGLAPIMAALVYGRGGEHIKSASIWFDKYLSLSNIESNDEIVVKERDESYKKAVFELQLQLITDADTMSNKVCNTSYECLQKKGYIKQSIEKSYNEICQQGKVTENLRCILLGIGLHNKWITLQGDLGYPLNNGFKFARSADYKSRWIVGIN